MRKREGQECVCVVSVGVGAQSRRRKMGLSLLVASVAHSGSDASRSERGGLHGAEAVRPTFFDHATVCDRLGVGLGARCKTVSVHPSISRANGAALRWLIAFLL
jgi:hypothetical protein